MGIRRAIARTCRLLGRALIGAMAGLVIITLIVAIADGYFHLLKFHEPAISDPRFQTTVGLGAAAFAALAAVSGKAEIRGNLGAAIKGILAGTAIGVVAGFACGPVLGAVNGGGIPGKAASSSASSSAARWAPLWVASRVGAYPTDRRADFPAKFPQPIIQPSSGSSFARPAEGFPMAFPEPFNSVQSTNTGASPAFTGNTGAGAMSSPMYQPNIPITPQPVPVK